MKIIVLEGEPNCGKTKTLGIVHHNDAGARLSFVYDLGSLEWSNDN